MDVTDGDVVKRVLLENHVDAERALAVLVRVLVDRHMECERRKTMLGAGHPANARPNSLTAVLDALHQAKGKNLQTSEACGGDDAADNPALSDSDFMTGVIAADLARIQQVLMQLLFESQLFAEREAGLLEDEDDDDDDDDRPPMKLAEY